MRNSKQQSFSVSIKSKRQHMRNQIRKEQLQQIFKTKRLQLFYGRQHDQKFQIFQELSQKIEICSDDLQMVQSLSNQIKDFCRKNPTQIWNFYLIGNFVIKRTEKAFDFQELILCEKSLEFSSIKEFAWCFAVYITQIVSSLSSGARDNTDHISIMQKFDIFMSQLIERYWRNFQLSEQSITVMEIYILCLTNILNSLENETFFPVITFNSLFSNLQKFYLTIQLQKKVFVRNIKIQITQLVNNIVHQIKTKELYSNEVREFTNELQKRFIINTASMEKFMKFAAEVFFQNLTGPSDDRICCIQSIRILCECNPIAAGEFLFTKKNVKEFQYLMLNHASNIRQLLLRSFKSILPSIINSKLIEFLDQSFHINLVYLMKKALEEFRHKDSSFQNKSSNLLFYTLSVIQSLLQKVQYLDAQMFQNVIHKMNMNDFGDLVDRMGGERYDQKIEEIWSNIVDCYFSDDVCQENHQSNRQNNGDLINQSHYSTNQYQIKKQNNLRNHLQDNEKRISQENEQCII